MARHDAAGGWPGSTWRAADRGGCGTRAAAIRRRVRDSADGRLHFLAVNPTGWSARELSASATATTSGATISSYNWSFDDGGTASGQTTSHIFSSPGNH